MLPSPKPATTHARRHNAEWVAVTIGSPANASDQPIHGTPVAADTSLTDSSPSHAAGQSD